MNCNSDFTKRAVVHSTQMPWKSSPMQGVERRMLDRLGDEVARATTIVRYAPKSKFSPHVHTGGEEFFVLDGVFQDEHGDYPAGSYVRNPPNSHHTPRSNEGCTIFVKLWQILENDDEQVCVFPDDNTIHPDRTRPGVETVQLFKSDYEDVRVETWAANTKLEIPASNGVEILVLDGSFVESCERFTKYSWLRFPKTEGANIAVGNDGARVWIKRGHLKRPPTHPKII